MKEYATEDADWVNVVGMWWKNRKEVQYAHQVFHKVMFQNTPLSKTSVHTRFITNDVAVVHLYWHMGAYTSPNGNYYKEAEIELEKEYKDIKKENNKKRKQNKYLYEKEKEIRKVQQIALYESQQAMLQKEEEFIAKFAARGWGINGP